MAVKIFSRSDTFKESEDGESLMKREEIEEIQNVRKILKPLAIVLVFIVGASIIFSILFCVASKIKGEGEDEDLYLVGMTWHSERTRVVEKRSLSLNDPHLCPKGYVWVPWKRRCICEAVCQPRMQNLRKLYLRLHVHSKSEDPDPNYPAKKLNFPQICPKMPRNGPKMATNDPKLAQE